LDAVGAAPGAGLCQFCLDAVGIGQLPGALLPFSEWVTVGSKSSGALPSRHDKDGQKFSMWRMQRKPTRC
jgi:hypothetical protein